MGSVPFPSFSLYDSSASLAVHACPRERELQYKHTLSVVCPIRRDTAGAFWALWDDKGICTIAGVSEWMWYWILGGGSSIHMLAIIWRFLPDSLGHVSSSKSERCCMKTSALFENTLHNSMREMKHYTVCLEGERGACAFYVILSIDVKAEFNRSFEFVHAQTTSCFEGSRMWMNNLSEQWPVTWLSLLLSFMAISCFVITITRWPMEFLASVIYTHWHCSLLWCQIFSSVLWHTSKL